MRSFLEVLGLVTLIVLVVVWGAWLGLSVDARAGVPAEIVGGGG